MANNNKLTIVMSGRKQSGKSSACKYIFTEFANRKIGKTRFVLKEIPAEDGSVVVVHDTFNGKDILDIDIPSANSRALADAMSVKIYSFADPLKKFCIDVLGLDFLQCYGTDEDKNTITHISWDSLPPDVLAANRKIDYETHSPKSLGFMTAREVMQVFGTDICRKLDGNCWARGTYSTIANEGYELAIVADGRFPNEITIGTEGGARAIRLLRNKYNDQHYSEKALDDFPHGEFDLVIDNNTMSLEDKNLVLKQNVIRWFNRHGVL